VRAHVRRTWFVGLMALAAVVTCAGRAYSGAASPPAPPSFTVSFSLALAPLSIYAGQTATKAFAIPPQPFVTRRIILVDPGDSFTDSVDIGGWFDFSRPGTYTVRFKRLLGWADNPNHVMLESNALSLRVKSRGGPVLSH